jgi:hypothetical protein
MFIAGREGTRAESFATCAGIVKAYVAVSPDSKPGFMKLRFDAPVHPAHACEWTAEPVVDPAPSR